jgi:hypothetical protein
MWVLILFYFSAGSPSVAMHDFATQAACEHASAAAQEVQRELPQGTTRIRGVCVLKG